MARYYITGGSDELWIATKAKTLTGAKRIAGKEYSLAVGGKIEIGEKYGNGDTERIERVAVRYGYDSWQSSY